MLIGFCCVLLRPYCILRSPCRFQLRQTASRPIFGPHHMSSSPLCDMREGTQTHEQRSCQWFRLQTAHAIITAIIIPPLFMFTIVSIPQILFCQCQSHPAHLCFSYSWCSYMNTSSCCWSCSRHCRCIRHDCHLLFLMFLFTLRLLLLVVRYFERPR